MIVGYARTSTVDQVAGFDAQLRDLEAAGVEKVFSEQVSSVAVRAGLRQALDFVREGDVFVVTRLDRLARSMADLLTITKSLERKGVALRVLNLNLDTSTSTGRLMLNLLGSIAQFERELMLERQREGIAKAKAEKRYLGRKPTARAKTAEVLELSSSGLPPLEIAKRLGLGKSSVYRIISDAAGGGGSSEVRSRPQPVNRASEAA